MPETINPFTNIPYLELPTPDDKKAGSSFISDVRELQVGQGGAEVFRADRQGIWLGAETFAAAPFKVGMNGVPVVPGLVVGTNVGLGTAQDSAGVTTIIGNVVTTGYVNALSVVAGSVAAENITGTYITGKTIRTATSGERIEMNAAAHNLLFYNSGGNVAGEIDSDGALNFGMANHINGGAMIFQLKTAGGATQTPLEIRADGIIFLQGIAKAHFLPYTTETYNLGSSGSKWSYLYVNYCATHFRPTSNALNLGDTSYRWGNIYAVAGNFSGDISASTLFATSYVRSASFAAAGGGKATFTGSVSACPLSISTKNALDLIGNPPYKTIKEIKKTKTYKIHVKENEKDNKFGVKRLYIDIEDTPKECHFINPFGEEDIEISRTVGFLYQCVVELKNKIKSLEQKK